jgi:hypothetical protein
MLPQNFYDPYPRYEQYGNRRYWLPGYYPPGKSQFQQRFPYDEESYYYSMLSNPEDYRWVFEITISNVFDQMYVT